MKLADVLQLEPLTDGQKAWQQEVKTLGEELDLLEGFKDDISTRSQTFDDDIKLLRKALDGWWDHVRPLSRYSKVENPFDILYFPFSVVIIDCL